MERIWISGDLGIGKPHKEIFAAAQDKLGLKPEEICFVGDAYGHDILGGQGRGHGRPSGLITEGVRPRGKQSRIMRSVPNRI